MLEAVIIGAGPYGLSLAAHFRLSGISFRIFGRAMDSWRSHMPKGMLLKSDGFASNIDDPRAEYPLRQFCAEQAIEYADSGTPVRLDTFVAYGLAFQQRMVPELEERIVAGVDKVQGGFRIHLDDGETLAARRVMVAVGITHFSHLPGNLRCLPGEFLSHSFQHHDLQCFKGRDVIVIGGGASATDLAALLHEAGAGVQLVARKNSLIFHSKSMSRNRSLWEQVRRPRSGLGPGLRSRFFANSPEIFHCLPQGLRLHAARTVLGPAGGWFIKDKVVGCVPILCGYTLKDAQIKGEKVNLRLHSANGSEREIQAEHVIAATGYKTDIDRLRFLSAEIRERIAAVQKTPVLSSTFESSVSGLYFVGIAATNSFGPVMRFAYGSAFAARRISRVVVRSLGRERVPATGPSAVSSAEENSDRCGREWWRGLDHYQTLPAEASVHP
jgi:thioredoxin reductase